MMHGEGNILTHLVIVGFKVLYVQKLVLLSDTRKKNVMNSGIAFQHLKQAGVALYDEDGTVIVGADIVNGDKELTLSLLWNVFVHLQASLLVNQFLLSEEIHKIHIIGVAVEYSKSVSSLRPDEPEDVIVCACQKLIAFFNQRPEQKFVFITQHGLLPLVELLEVTKNRVTCAVLQVLNQIIKDNTELL